MLDEYIDWPAMQLQYQGKQGFIIKLLLTFMQSHAATPAKLRAAANVADFVALAIVAHGFAGVAGNIHAGKLCEQGRGVELLAKSGDPAAIHAAEVLAGSIENFMCSLKIYLVNQG